jgi:hypothetical protein
MTRTNIMLITYSISLVIILLFIVPSILLFSMESVAYDSQPGLGGTSKVFGDTVLSQDVYFNHTDLSQIGMSIKNPVLINKKDILLQIYNLDGTLLSSAKVSGKNIPDGSLVKFTFPAIENSKDKWFILVLSARDSSENEALEVFLTDDSVSWLSNFSKNGSKESHNIALQAYYTIQDHFGLIKLVYSTWANLFLRSGWFAGVYIFAIACATGCILGLNLKKSQW